jgi:hypothetical protein
LLSSGANPNVFGWNGRTPLHVAGSWWQKDLVDILLEGKADVDLESPDGETPLMSPMGPRPALNGVVLSISAVRHRDEVDLGLIQSLLGDPQTYAPLHLAVVQARSEAAKLILEKQGPLHLNRQDERGNTALHLAVESGFVEMVILLLDYGADRTIRNPYGWTPLHLAVRKSEIEMVQILKPIKLHFNSHPWHRIFPIHPSDIRGRMHQIISDVRDFGFPDSLLIHVLQLLTKLDQDDHLWIVFSALCQFRLGNHAEAIELHEESLLRNPRNDKAESANQLQHGFPCDQCYNEIIGRLYKCETCCGSYCAKCSDIKQRFGRCQPHKFLDPIPQGDWEWDINTSPSLGSSVPKQGLPLHATG